MQQSSQTATSKLLTLLAEHCPATVDLGKDLDHWKQLVDRHFLPHATFRLTTQQRHFDLPQPFLARFYWIQFVFCNMVHFAFAPTSVPLEQLVAPNTVVVTIPTCSLVQYFHTAAKALIYSHCALRVTYTLDHTHNLKIEFWDLVYKSFEESIDRHSIYLLSSTNTDSDTHAAPNNSLLLPSSSPSTTTTTVPASFSLPDPVANENGIHVRLMRALEIADVVNSMKDLILFSQAKHLGALQSLHQMASLIDQHASSRQKTPPHAPPLTPTTLASPASALTSPHQAQFTTTTTQQPAASSPVQVKSEPNPPTPTTTTSPFNDLLAFQDAQNAVVEETASSVSSNTSASLLLDAFLKSEPVSPRSSPSPTTPTIPDYSVANDLQSTPSPNTLHQVLPESPPVFHSSPITAVSTALQSPPGGSSTELDVVVADPIVAEQKGQLEMSPGLS